MKKIALTVEQKSALEIRHKKSCGKRDSDRIKTVLLRNESWSTSMIAQALRVHENSVVRFIKRLTMTPILNFALFKI
jgi:predicted ArsR family transcriptional regulator